MAKNDFKAFAIGENANTLSQEEYESSDFIEEGFKSGIARSERLNKVWRQSSVIAAVIGKYIAEKTGEDVMDDGDLEKLVAQLDLALKHKITTEIPAASLTQKGISQLNSATNSDREDQAATPKSVHDVRKIAESKLSGVSDASLTQKGIVQLSNATNSTNETLAATPKAIKEAYDFANTANVAAKNAHDEANRATDNANSRLAKNQNGADIPNKSEFIKNLGLTETVELAKSAYPKSGGVLDGYVDATGSISGRGVYEYPSIRVYSAVNKPSPGELGAYTTGECDGRYGSKNMALKSTNGWWKCGDTGVIYQWGVTRVLEPLEIITVQLPVRFSNACVNVMLTVNRLGASGGIANGYSAVLSPSSFKLTNDYANTGISVGYYWFVVGY
ncbi:hypothetical protein C6H68_18960 [Photorhabdus luminescens]|nr:hypothetical protein C6H68_18960 [Photorhabdus luminescens]